MLDHSHNPDKINEIIDMTTKFWQLIYLTEFNSNFNLTMCCNGLKSHHLTISLNLLSPKNENKVPYFPSKGFFNTLIKKKKVF